MIAADNKAAGTTMTLKHWKLDADGDGLAWLTIDRAGASINSLSAEVLEELRSVLGDLGEPPERALIYDFVSAAEVRLDARTPERYLARLPGSISTAERRRGFATTLAGPRRQNTLQCTGCWR